MEVDKLLAELNFTTQQKMEEEGNLFLLLTPVWEVMLMAIHAVKKIYLNGGM